MPEFTRGILAESAAMDLWSNARHFATSQVQNPWLWIAKGLAELVSKEDEILRWRFLRAYEAGLGLFWVLKNGIVAVPRPVIYTQDSRFHCEIGPAVSWPSGLSLWFWKGVRATEQIVMHPETLPLDAV